MIIKTFTALTTFALFAYGTNTPVGDKRGDYAIFAGIAILLAVFLFKTVIASRLSKAVNILRNPLDDIEVGSYVSDATPIELKPAKQVKAEPKKRDISKMYFDYVSNEWKSIR